MQAHASHVHTSHAHASHAHARQAHASHVHTSHAHASHANGSHAHASHAHARHVHASHVHASHVHASHVHAVRFSGEIIGTCQLPLQDPKLFFPGWTAAGQFRYNRRKLAKKNISSGAPTAAMTQQRHALADLSTSTQWQYCRMIIRYTLRPIPT